MYQMLDFIQDSEEEDVACGLGIWKDFQKSKVVLLADDHLRRYHGYCADRFYYPETGSSYILVVNCCLGLDPELKNLFLEFRKELIATISQQDRSVNRKSKL